jgi:hypothetical protein
VVLLWGGLSDEDGHVIFSAVMPQSEPCRTH